MIWINFLPLKFIFSKTDWDGSRNRRIGSGINFTIVCCENILKSIHFCSPLVPGHSTKTLSRPLMPSLEKFAPMVSWGLHSRILARSLKQPNGSLNTLGSDQGGGDFSWPCFWACRGCLESNFGICLEKSHQDCHGSLVGGSWTFNLSIGFQILSPHQRKGYEHNSGQVFFALGPWWLWPAALPH